jgi:hypothetical protein
MNDVVLMEVAKAMTTTEDVVMNHWMERQKTKAT